MQHISHAKIAQMLKELLIEKQMSQQELADLLNINQSSISRLLNCKLKLSSRNTKKVLEYIMQKNAEKDISNRLYGAAQLYVSVGGNPDKLFEIISNMTNKLFEKNNNEL